MGEGLRFDDFELFRARRRLLRSGEPVRPGSRALDILIALIVRPGEIVAKNELMASVWPNTFVEENNLRVHLTALRKALEDDHASARFIKNIPGRGYSFIAPVSGRQTPQPEPAVQQPAQKWNNLPALLGNIIGRDEVVTALAEQFTERRLVTVAGPGGIGKTRVALVVAERLAPAYAEGVLYLDLAPVSDPRFLAGLLAAALGQPVRSACPVRDLAAFRHDRRLLIVLDGCEHVVDAAAQLAERQVPRIGILATSREPLRAEGEWVYRLVT